MCLAVRTRLAQIEKQIAEMESGELFQLYEEVTKAEAQGRDLLSEMVLAVDVRIRAASEHLAELNNLVHASGTKIPTT